MITTLDQLTNMAVGTTLSQFKLAFYDAGMDNETLEELRSIYGDMTHIDEILRLVWESYDVQEYVPSELEALVDDVTNVIGELVDEISERPNDYKAATLKRIGRIRDQLRLLENRITEGVF